MRGEDNPAQESIEEDQAYVEAVDRGRYECDHDCRHLWHFLGILSGTEHSAVRNTFIVFQLLVDYADPHYGWVR